MEVLFLHDGCLSVKTTQLIRIDYLKYGIPFTLLDTRHGELKKFHVNNEIQARKQFNKLKFHVNNEIQARKQFNELKFHVNNQIQARKQFNEFG